MLSLATRRSFIVIIQLRVFLCQYNAVDTSPLSNYVMHPLWNVVVTMFPMWVAPNFLTLLGCLLLIVNYVTLSFYDFDYHTTCNDLGIVRPPIPRWVFLFCAILHILSHTLDGIDGKQARRTNSSSPLGELFDHGLDTISVLIIVQCMYSLFGTCVEWGGNLWTMHVIYLLTLFGFYLTHWEKFITGILYLPWSYDASQLGTLVIYLVHWWFGPEGLHIRLLGVSAGSLFAVIVIVTIMCGIIMSAWNIYSAAQKQQLRISTDSGFTFLVQSIQPFCPLLLAFGLTYLWTVVSTADVLSKQPRIFFLMEGLLFSNCCVRFCC
jgi:ethanolaminephosphotransferase